MLRWNILNNIIFYLLHVIKGFFYLLFIKISLSNLCSESLRASNFEILIENPDTGDLSSITVRKECLFACQFWYWGWEVGRKHYFVNFCFVPHKYYFLTKSNSFTELATLLTKMKYFEYNFFYLLHVMTLKAFSTYFL